MVSGNTVTWWQRWDHREAKCVQTAKHVRNGCKQLYSASTTTPRHSLPASGREVEKIQKSLGQLFIGHWTNRQGRNSTGRDSADEEALEVYAMFTNWTSAEDEAKIEPALTQLEQYCQLQRNVPFERYRFNRRSQEAGEIYDQYHTAGSLVKIVIFSQSHQMKY